MQRSAEEIRPGIAVILFDGEGRVLLQKRADVGKWGLISGHMEPGETVEEAVIREVLEETGLQVKIERFIGVYTDPASQIFAYPDGRTVHFVTLYFAVKVMDGDLKFSPRIPEESLELCFFPVEEIPEDLIPMHPQWLEDAMSGRTGLVR